jgi:hypothetical protein
MGALINPPMGSGSGSGAYSQYIEPKDKEALMSTEVFNEIFSAVPQKSIFMSMARKLKDMNKYQEQLRVLDALPYVSFVGQRGGSDKTFDSLKQTTKMAWDEKYIVPGEIAAIIPVDEDSVEDEDYPIWDEVKGPIVEGIGQLVDLATIVAGVPGVNVPAAWPNAIVPGCPPDHIIPLKSIGDLYADLLEPNGVWNEVEEDGYAVTGWAADIGMKAAIRACRTKDGMPVFGTNPADKLPYSIDGVQGNFSMNGGWDPSVARLVAGDWSQAVWSIRKDVTWKILDQAVITDANKQIIFNLAQEDMIAIRVTFRFGWQLPNPVNRMEPDKTQRYPFAILTGNGSGSGSPVP